MFVDVEDFKGAIAVENILAPYKKGRLAPDKKTRLPKEPITPEVCMEILKSTNYARNIKDMLLCITELPQSEQGQFKDVVLACFSNREQPNDILALGKKLAVANGFEEELSLVKYQANKMILLSAPKLSKGFVWDGDELKDDFSQCGKLWCSHPGSLDVLTAAKLPEIVEIPYAKHIDFQCIDCAGVKEIHYPKGAHLFLNFAKNLPKDFDFSRADELHLAGCDLRDFTHLAFKKGAKVVLKSTILPKDFDVSQCAEIYFIKCDFGNQNRLKFMDGARVSFDEACNLPKNLDVANCSKVRFAHCSLADQPHIRFMDGAEVDLQHSVFLPENLDVSNCAVVDLTGCDFEGKRVLGFMDGARVNLSDALNLPKDLDVSPCAWVNLSRCNLKRLTALRFRKDAAVYFDGVTQFPKNMDVSECAVVSLRDCHLCAFSELKFQSGADVCLSFARGLPAVLDVSPCAKVYLSGAFLDDVQQIVFKNKKQMEQCKFNKKEWKGKIVYTDTPVFLQKLMNLKWR